MAIKSVSAAVAVCLFMSQPVQANPLQRTFDAVSGFLDRVVTGIASHSQGNPDDAPNVRQFTDFADSLENRVADNRANTTEEMRERQQELIDWNRESGEYLSELHDEAPRPSPQMSASTKAARDAAAQLDRAKKRQASAEKNLARKQKAANIHTRLAVQNPKSRKMAENAEKANKAANRAKKNHKQKTKAVDRAKQKVRNAS